jgi:hypothetical protein
MPGPSRLREEIEAYLAEPPIAVTAPDLLKAYQDEAAADKRFKDRKVWITGYVLRTGRTAVGAPYVELAPGPGEEGLVRCFCDRFTKGGTLLVTDLKENQEVIVEGRVVARGGNQIRVNDCRLLTLGHVEAVSEAARRKKNRK